MGFPPRLSRPSSWLGKLPGEPAASSLQSCFSLRGAAIPFPSLNPKCGTGKAAPITRHPNSGRDGAGRAGAGGPLPNHGPPAAPFSPCPSSCPGSILSQPCRGSAPAGAHPSPVSNLLAQFLKELVLLGEAVAGDGGHPRGLETLPPGAELGASSSPLAPSLSVCSRGSLLAEVNKGICLIDKPGDNDEGNLSSQPRKPSSASPSPWRPPLPGTPCSRCLGNCIPNPATRHGDRGPDGGPSPRGCPGGPPELCGDARGANPKPPTLQANRRTWRWQENWGKNGFPWKPGFPCCRRMPSPQQLPPQLKKKNKKIKKKKNPGPAGCPAAASLGGCGEGGDGVVQSGAGGTDGAEVCQEKAAKPRQVPRSPNRPASSRVPRGGLTPIAGTRGSPPVWGERLGLKHTTRGALGLKKGEKNEKG